MKGTDIIEPQDSFLSNKVFEEISYIRIFYDSISQECWRWIPNGVSTSFPILNYNQYVFSSLEGTLDTIQTILKKNRITDALVLVRKYFDDVLVSIYMDVYRKEHFDLENNYSVEDAEKWIKDKYRIPTLKGILKLLKKSSYTKELYPFFGWETYLKRNRELLDDYVHSNRFQSFLLNCHNYIPNREKWLDNVSIILSQIFTMHLSFLFCLNSEYFIASDFMDSLDEGIPAPEGSDHWIAPNAQEAFDKYIKSHTALANYIKKKSFLNID